MKRFASLVLVLALVLPTFVGSLAHADTVEFTDTVRVVMGSRESQDEVRVYATQEAKRRVLDKVGVYLSGSTEIVRRVEESFGVPHHSNESWNPSSSSSSSSSPLFLDSTSLLTRIQTLTVGVVQTEVVSEEWKSEGGAFVLYLVCRVKVDPVDALARLTELLKDKQKVEDYQKVQEEVERLRGDLAQLRLDLESAKTEKEKVAVKEEVQEKINEMSANDWFEKGLKTTNLDDEIACCSFAIQLNPNWSSPYNNRGVAYYEKGDFDRAIEDLSRAIQIDPNFAMPYNNRGNAYSKKGNFDRAIEDFNHAIQFDPNYAFAYYNRGIEYYARGDFERAIEDFNHAIQIDPNYAFAYNNRGNAYCDNGDIDRAIKDFNRAIQIDLNYATAYNNRGKAYGKKGDFEHAIDDFNRAIQIDPNDAIAYYNRGVANFKKGDSYNGQLNIQRAADLGLEEAKQALEEMR